MSQREIDANNLRFYGDLFREHQWHTDVLHWSVFIATLNEIADRIVEHPTPEPATVLRCAVHGKKADPHVTGEVTHPRWSIGRRDED